MNDLDDALADAFSDLADRAPHDPSLAVAVRRRVRRGRMTAAGAAAATSAAVIAGVSLLPDGVLRSAPSPSVGSATVAPACAGAVTRGVLPEWARGGFSDPEPVMPFVRSTRGGVVAILFADPLHSPPRQDIGNKVLWVWRQPPGAPSDVRMVARLNGAGPGVTAGLPSPFGPSYVDLPSPGCWELTLSWPGGSDTLYLPAVTPAR